MTVAERRAALEKNPTAKIIWIVLLVLEGLAACYSGLLLLLALLFGGLGVGGIITVFTDIAAVLIIALAIFIFIGLLKLEKWIVWLAWVNVALSLPTLLKSGTSFFSGLLPILIAIGYTYIIRTVYPKTPVLPGVNPPPTPPTPPVQK